MARVEYGIWLKAAIRQQDKGSNNGLKRGATAVFPLLNTFRGQMEYFTGIVRRFTEMGQVCIEEENEGPIFVDSASVFPYTTMETKRCQDERDGLRETHGARVRNHSTGFLTFLPSV